MIHNKEIKQQDLNLYFKKKYGKKFTLNAISLKKDRHVYSLGIANEKLIVKCFFGADAKNRFNRERFFYHAVKKNTRFVNYPLADLIDSDELHRVLILSRIHGGGVSNQISADNFTEIELFLGEIQKCKDDYNTPIPLYASDSAFSFGGHYKNLKNRIQRMQQAQKNLKSGRFSEHVAWLSGLLSLYIKKIDDVYIDNESIWVNFEHLVVSPSDFGLHNMIKTEDRMYFIDFEHAGLDDPAKLYCDFVLNPKYALPSLWHSALFDFLQNLTNDISLSARVRLLKPLFIIRWACIICSDALKADCMNGLNCAINISHEFIIKNWNQEFSEIEDIIR